VPPATFSWAPDLQLRAFWGPRGPGQGRAGQAPRRKTQMQKVVHPPGHCWEGGEPALSGVCIVPSVFWGVFPFPPLYIQPGQRDLKEGISLNLQK